MSALVGVKLISELFNLNFSWGLPGVVRILKGMEKLKSKEAEPGAVAPYQSVARLLEIDPALLSAPLDSVCLYLLALVLGWRADVIIVIQMADV